MFENLEKNLVYTVSKLNNYIKSLFDNTPTLKMIHLEGEIYDLKQSGPHHYFMLKDETSSIRGVLFYSDPTKLDIRVKNGDLVLVTGSVGVYPQRGQYQVYAQNITLYGQGNLLIELEKLKKQLASEGLFDQEKKKPINLYPNAVGLISAKNSAAIQDMVVNLKRRYPLCDIYVFDALVQGTDAPKDLIRAYNLSLDFPLSTLIIGRGGGASEDLSAFNDEKLIRTLASRKIPLISAVGHEIDTTLVDLVSDKRASTPTGAVELASVDSREILESLSEARTHLNRSIKKTLDIYGLKLESLRNRPELQSPLSVYQERLNNLASQKDLLIKEIKQIIERRAHFLENYRQNLDNRMKIIYESKLKGIEILKNKLEGLNPKTILNLGYSITRDSNGQIIKSINGLKENQVIVTTLNDGNIESKISKIEKEKK